MVQKFDEPFIKGSAKSRHRIRLTEGDFSKGEHIELQKLESRC